VFALNTIGCLAITGLTAFKRMLAARRRTSTKIGTFVTSYSGSNRSRGLPSGAQLRNVHNL